MGTIYGPAVEGTLGKGSIAPLSQNSTTPYTITWKTLDEAVYSLSGMTITGKFTDRNTGTDYSVSGTIALVGDGTAGQFTWTPSAADGGTAGLYNLHFKATNGTVTAWSYAVEWKVLPVPGASVTPPAGETTVSQAAADLIDSLLTLAGLAKFDGAGAASEIKIKLDSTTAPTVNEDSGDGYGVGSLWVDTTNDNIYICTDATVGAANWEQVNGAGTVSSVFGRTGAITATSGDYGTDEITDDSTLAQASLTAAINLLSSNSNTTSNDLETHIELTTTAHGGIVPHDAAILSKTGAYELAAGDEAKIIECSGTFAVNCPNGLDTGFQVAIAPISGAVTLTATTTLQYWSGGSLVTASGAVTLNAMVSVYHAGSNVWRVAGDVTE